ncbi:MAG: hypothetical protein SGBAC_013069 [Bacillariaceae sp.]
MDQQLRGSIRRRGPLENSATRIQAQVRGFLIRKDTFVIEVRPSLGRYASHVSALTVEGFSTRSLCSYQEDLQDEHPGFEGASNRDLDFCSPIRKPRRIASTESAGSLLFHTSNNNGMLTVDEDDEHPGFDSPNSDEEPVKRPTRLLSKESVDSSSFLDESDLLFSPKTVDAACAPSKKRSSKKLLKMMQKQPIPFSRGQKKLEGRARPKDRPAVLPVRHRSDTSNDLQ